MDIVCQRRYMIFFQLPLVPETLLTAFRGALAQIVFQLQRDTLERDEAKIYMDVFRRPGSKSFSNRAFTSSDNL